LSSQQINHWVNNFSLFQSAAANAPQSTRVITGYATELMNKAQQATDVKERDSLVQESVQYLERGLQIFPDNYQAATKLGIIYSMRGEDQRAKTYYLRSIHSHPDNVMSLNNVGSLYSKMNQNDSAIFYFKETLKLEPFNEMALRNLVITNSNAQHYSEVVKYAAQFAQYRYQDAKVNELKIIAEQALKK
jgi:tetratricopeptide (TPR) repeat protein